METAGTTLTDDLLCFDPPLFSFARILSIIFGLVQFVLQSVSAIWDGVVTALKEDI